MCTVSQVLRMSGLLQVATGLLIAETITITNTRGKMKTLRLSSLYRQCTPRYPMTIRNAHMESNSKKLVMGQWFSRIPSSTMETKWKTAPRAKAPSATRNICSRRRTRVMMACRRPMEYSAAATRSQMTLISAMDDPVPLSLKLQYTVGVRSCCPPHEGGKRVWCGGLYAASETHSHLLGTSYRFLTAL